MTYCDEARSAADDEARAGARPQPRPRLRPGRRGVGVAAVLAAALIWSTSFAVTKVALLQIPPMTIGALRFSLAAVVLAVAVRLRPDRRLPTPRQRLTIGLAGLLGISLYFALENFGVDLATASDATLIVASYPVITLALELVLRRATVSVVRLAGMLVAMGGVWLVVQGAPETNAGHRMWGDALLIAGGGVWAAYNLMARRDSSGASPIVVTYYQTLFGAGGFIAMSLFEARRWVWPSPANLGRVLFLAGLCSVTAFLLYNFGLRRLLPSIAVNLLNIVPVAGLGWAMLLARESVNAVQLAGGAIVIAGVGAGLYQNATGRTAEDRRSGPRRAAR